MELLQGENMKVFNTPIYACIDLTYKCNFSCRHCMFLNENLKEYTTAQIINLLDRLEDEKFVAVQFSGGEPLLRDDFLEILDYSSRKRFAISLATNGSLIDDKLIQHLKQSKVKNIQLSIDGLEKSNNSLRGSGTFNTIVKALDKLLENNLPVAVATMVTKENIEEMKEMLDFLSKKNIQYWRLQHIICEMADMKNKLISIDEYLKAYESIIEYAKERDVNFPITMPCYFRENVPSNSCERTLINISPDGKITGCFLNNTKEGEFIPLSCEEFKKNNRKGRYYICTNAFEVIEGNESIRNKSYQ